MITRNATEIYLPRANGGDFKDCIGFLLIYKK
jgi:hypothetical protein